MSGAPLALPSSSLIGGDEAILVDALPYLDSGYGEAERQMALQLIEAECKVFRPTKNYLKDLPVPEYDAFLTPTLVKENARMTKKVEMQKLDLNRCELPSPANTNKAGDLTAWKKAISNAKAQNEHLLLRAMNLELLDQYGGEAYLRLNKELEAQLAEEEKELRACRDAVMETHARRRTAQVDAGRRLARLEENWVGMVTKNYRLELENQHLDEANRNLAKRLKLDPALAEPILAE